MRWLLWGVAVIVLAALVVSGVWLANHHAKQHKIAEQNAAQNSDNPAHLHGIAVGDFAYVSACSVFTTQNLHDVFAPLEGDGLVQAKYAEAGLPVKDIPAAGIDSTCSRQFWANSSYADTTLTVDVKQFATTAAAQKEYDSLSQTQSDLNNANQAFGSNFTTDFTPLGGLSHTVYSPSRRISYTLVDNKIISFTALLSGVSDSDYLAALTKAIPVAVANTSAAKPTYNTISEPSFGKAIGSATIMNPCSFFTGADFQKAAGHKADPTDVQIQYDFNADKYPRSDIADGYAVNSCERDAYPKTQTGIESISVELHYYKTTNEAVQQAPQQAAATASRSSSAPQPVSGVGTYAALVKDFAGNTDLYVQKGPYMLVIHALTANASGQTEPDAQTYAKIANIVVARLH